MQNVVNMYHNDVGMEGKAAQLYISNDKVHHKMTPFSTLQKNLAINMVKSITVIQSPNTFHLASVSFLNSM